MHKKLTNSDAEFNFWKEIYAFRCKYYIPEHDPKYWQDVVTEADEICKRYNTEFCKNVVLEIVKDYERRYKEMRRC